MTKEQTSWLNNLNETLDEWIKMQVDVLGYTQAQELKILVNVLINKAASQEKEKIVEEVIQKYGDYTNNCGCCAGAELKETIKEDLLQNK